MQDDDEIGESRVGVEAAKREDAGRVREARAEASQATQVRRVLARVSARVRAGGEPARIHDARPAGVNGSDMCVPAPLDSRLATNRCSRAFHWAPRVQNMFIGKLNGGAINC